MLAPTTVTLEDFVALNHEIAALARAGVPLGPGLTAFGRDLPGRLGKIAAEVGERLERGEPLDRIVAENPNFPPAYKAVVQAGVRVGRLPAALEGISQSARRTAQLRWTISMAIIYPLTVMCLGYCLFVFTLSHISPVMAEMLADHGVEDTLVHQAIIWLGKYTLLWGFVLPSLVLAWLAWLWWRAGRVAAGVELHPFLSFGAVSTMLKMRQAGRLAAMCDSLALLTEYGVSLPEAVPLAAQTTGARKLERAAQQLAEQMTLGEKSTAPPRNFPPLLAWMLTSGQLQQDLPLALRRAAAVYRDEANRRAQWLRLYVPLILTLFFGGGTVAIYAAMTLGPFLLILYKLAGADFQA